MTHPSYIFMKKDGIFFESFYRVTNLNYLGFRRLEQLLEPNHFNCFINLPIDQFVGNFERLLQDVHFPILNEDNVRYDPLAEASNRTVPEGFFNIFQHLPTVYGYYQTDVQIDPDRLLKFLGSCPSLKEISFDGCQIGQKVLDELPRIGPLKRVTLMENNVKNDIDFRFLNRTYYLEEFSANKNLVKREGLNLNRHKYLLKLSFCVRFNKNNYLAWFRLKISKNKKGFLLTIDITKSDDRRRLLFNENDIPIKEISYEELIKQANLLEYKLKNKIQRQKRTKRFMVSMICTCSIIFSAICFSVQFCTLLDNPAVY